MFKIPANRSYLPALAALGTATAMAMAMAVPAEAAETSSSTTAPGLAVTVAGGGQTDVMVLPDVAWHVRAGEPPTPFLPPGPFTAVWEGSLQAELRGTYFFQATVAGTLTLEINGQTVLDSSQLPASGPAGTTVTPISKPVVLSKGPNPLKVAFTAPAKGDALVRLGWSETGSNVNPIARTALTHVPSPRIADAHQLRLGRELFLEHRCVQCHVDRSLAGNGVPELAMDAPALAGIGARRHYEWMVRWIQDPRAVRPSARMPRLLHGPNSSTNAQAMAAYLASLKDPNPGGAAAAAPPAYQTRQPLAEGAPEPAATEPRPLYERLHCAACHNPPDATTIDPAKLSQKGVATKFPKGRLAEYLRAPEAGYAWTRMPNFHLSEAEAQELETYLLATATPPPKVAAPTDAALIEKGRGLVQSSGCLNCHSLPLENTFKAPTLASLRARVETRGASPLPGDCLGAAPTADHGFSSVQKAALARFMARGSDSLRRHSPVEFAERQARLLNCAACHGQIELVPPMELLGGKLTPEWSARFIGGEIRHKMRFDNHPRGEVWLEARMPAFPSRATDLARGLAASHGFPAVTPAEPPIDLAASEAGRKLVGKDGGLSCSSCHAFGAVPALEVFESEGINLALTADRLQPSFYRRWFANPTSIDPQTKMPKYFNDDGTSPLTDILNGSAAAQIDAVWQFLRLRDKIGTQKTDEP